MTILVQLLVYNLVVFAVFTSLNYAQKNDFEYLTPGDDRNFTSILYYTFSVHAVLGIGDINPKTQLARYTTMIHLSVALVGSAYIIYGTRRSNVF